MLSQSSNRLLPQRIQCGNSIRIHALVQAAGSVPMSGAFVLPLGKGGVIADVLKNAHGRLDWKKLLLFLAKSDIITIMKECFP